MNYIVTAVDHRAWDSMLVPFIGSLRERGKWDQPLIVLDYGLSSVQREILHLHDIRIEAPLGVQTIYLDRFSSIARLAKRDGGTYYLYDADIWFAHPITDLMGWAKPGQLGFALDAWASEFLLHCLNEGAENVQTLHQLIRHSKQKDGQVPQAGLTVGDAESFGCLDRVQRILLEKGCCRDFYGTDTLSLLMYRYLFEEKSYIVPKTFNAVPNLSELVQKEPGPFFLDDQLVRALHCTRPFRKTEKFTFAHHFPREYAKWQSELSPREMGVAQSGSVKF